MMYEHFLYSVTVVVALEFISPPAQSSQSTNIAYISWLRDLSDGLGYINARRFFNSCRLRSLEHIGQRVFVYVTYWFDEKEFERLNRLGSDVSYHAFLYHCYDIVWENKLRLDVPYSQEIFVSQMLAMYLVDRGYFDVEELDRRLFTAGYWSIRYLIEIRPWLHYSVIPERLSGQYLMFAEFWHVLVPMLDIASLDGSVPVSRILYGPGSLLSHGNE